MTNMKRPVCQDDIAVWPDGSWAELGEVWNGDYDWKSDDFEIVRFDDVERLKALGIADDLGIP